MAKVKNPLCSLQATGDFGSRIMFGDWKGIKTARVSVPPGTAPTSKQLACRSRYGYAVQWWRNGPMTTDVKAAWRLGPEWGPYHDSPWNGFCPNLIAGIELGDQYGTVWKFEQTGAVPRALKAYFKRCSNYTKNVSVKPFIYLDWSITRGIWTNRDTAGFCTPAQVISHARFDVGLKVYWRIRIHDHFISPIMINTIIPP